MRYFRLLLGHTVLNCQRNSNILDGLKTDKTVDFRAHQKNCLHHLKQKTPVHCQERFSNTSPRNNGT